MTPPRKTSAEPSTELRSPVRRSPESILGDLRDRLRRKAPELSSRGPEDPAWVFLEVVAESLAEIEGRAELMEERVFPRVLESLGDEPRWASGASTSVVFRPLKTSEAPILIPRGTRISAPRRDGEARLSFETLADGWTSHARLLRAVTCAGDSAAEIFPHPESGWDGEAVPLFGGREIVARHLYLGDSALLALRDGARSLLLEWPGSPHVLWEGSWEHSIRGGWRSVQVELEEAQVGSKKCVLLRVRGPLPDLAEEEVDSTRLPWLRLSLEGGRRTTLSQPRWIASEPRSFANDFPRHVARILSFGGERWEDHSLTAQRIVPAESPEAWDPALYLGWDSPVPASIFFSIQGRPSPPGWADGAGSRQPRFVWEHSAGRGFRPFELSDGTDGFTRSGSVTWDLLGDWTPQEHFGERLHWLRARWISGAYRSAPMVRALVPHGILARQQTSLESHWIEAALDRRGRGPMLFTGSEGEPERFDAVEIQKNGSWSLLVSRAASPLIQSAEASLEDTRKPGGSFKVLRSLPDGYVLDAGAQWADATAIRIPKLLTTWGTRGDVPAGTLSLLDGAIEGVAQATQPLPAEGGRDAEDPDSFRRRIRSEWKTSGRAVTPDDYQRLAMGLDSEIARVESAAEPNAPWRVRVCVVPVEPCCPGRFTPVRLEWLAEMLEVRSPVGTVVEVMEPSYLPVEIKVRPGEGLAWPEPFRRRIEDALRELFHPLRGGVDGKGFPSGAWPRGEELASALARHMSDVDTRPLAVDVSRSRFELSLPGGMALPACVTGGSCFATAPLVIPCLERLTLDASERL